MNTYEVEETGLSFYKEWLTTQRGALYSARRFSIYREMNKSRYIFIDNIYYSMYKTQSNLYLPFFYENKLVIISRH